MDRQINKQMGRQTCRQQTEARAETKLFLNNVKYYNNIEKGKILPNLRKLFKNS